MSGLVSRLMDRFSLEHQEDAELQQQSVVAGCTAVAEAPNREKVQVHGVLRSVALRPVDQVTALEAELYDGSAPLTLVWLGRRRIVGISPGRGLTVTGRIGRRGSERVMYNPAYRLDP